MSQPYVCIIILNYNGEKWLGQCLDSLTATSYENFSILLVDNASNDNSLKIVQEKFPQVDIIANESNLGFSEGNNVGIRAALEAHADYIILLNPDTKVMPEWLSELIRVGECNSSIGILGSLQLCYENNEYNSWTTSALSQHLSLLEPQMKSDQWISVDWVEGSCMAIKASVFSSIGLLDPIYFAFYEEIDFCRRAKYHGYQIAIIPLSRIHHHRGGIWRSSPDLERKRNLLSDRSQFVYNLTDPGRSLTKNSAYYLITLATKVKCVIREKRFSALFDLLKIQLNILLHLNTILRKWNKDREVMCQNRSK